MSSPNSKNTNDTTEKGEHVRLQDGENKVQDVAPEPMRKSKSHEPEDIVIKAEIHNDSEHDNHAELGKPSVDVDDANVKENKSISKPANGDLDLEDEDEDDEDEQPVAITIDEECENQLRNELAKSERADEQVPSENHSETYSIKLTDDDDSKPAAIEVRANAVDTKPPAPPLPTQSLSITMDNSPLLPPTGYFRFGIAILTLASILLANMNRQAFNQALTEMILPENESRKNEHDDRLSWTNIQSGELKSSFSLGYAIFMIPSARLGEIMGTKWIVFASTFGSGLCSILVPYLAAHDHFTILKLSRFFMGMCQAGVAPALFAIVARWLSDEESGLFLPLIKGGVSFGLLLGSASVGLLSWQASFYLCGGIALVFAAIWVFYVTSVPEDNKLMSNDELKYIQQQMQLRDGSKKKASVSVEAAKLTVPTGSPLQNNAEPRSKETSLIETIRQHPYVIMFVQEAKLWARIFINWPVIGVMLVKWTMRLSTDAQTQYLADFFKNVHKLSKKDNSIVNCINYAIQGVLTIHIVWLVNYCLEKRTFGLNKTGIRRLFQCGCSFGMAASYILITFDLTSLNLSLSGVVMLALTNILQSGADSMMPYDLSPTYCGTIMGVANSFANTAGVVLPKIVGWTVGNDTSNLSLWANLFWIVGGLIGSGGFIFILLVKAKVQPFDPAYEQSRLRAKQLKESQAKETIEMTDIKHPKSNVKNANATKHELTQREELADDKNLDSHLNSNPKPKLSQLTFQEWRASRGAMGEQKV